MKTIVPKEITEFVIDRKVWYRGQGPSESCLLRTDGTMCCLGIYAKACGVPDAALLGTAYLGGIPHTNQLPVPIEITGQMKRLDSKNRITATNDYKIENSKRESYLAELFLEEGVKVTFTGGTAS